MPDVVVVLTTFPADPGAAQLFARTLVEERLAACVNVQPPMTSIYWWDDKVDEAQECQLTIKTAASRVQALITRIQDLHPYDVPEILVLPVADGSAAYVHWVSDSVTKKTQN